MTKGKRSGPAVRTAGVAVAVTLGIGAFGGAVAGADPHPDSGSYDEQTNVGQEACWGEVPAGSAHQPFVVGAAGNAGCAHERKPS